MKKIEITLTAELFETFKGFNNDELVKFLTRGKYDVEFRRGYMKQRNEETKEARRLYKLHKEQNGSGSR